MCLPFNSKDGDLKTLMLKKLKSVNQLNHKTFRVRNSFWFLLILSFYYKNIYHKFVTFLGEKNSKEKLTIFEKLK